MNQPRFSTLQQWLDWQQSLHGRDIDLGLERIRAVYQHLRPDLSRSCVITVAGTNGKGSTLAMLGAIYQAAGYRVGSFTSPHFLHYNERICIDGRAVSDEMICSAFARIDEARGEISLTYFEFSALAALLIFAESGLDVILLEVGLGGRLDAANLLDADCAIVTSISIDHRDWLGDTREAIGYEKAGIFRQGRPAICGDLDIPATVEAYAREVGACWMGRGDDFQPVTHEQTWDLQIAGPPGGPARVLEGLSYPGLSAPVQLVNAASAVRAVEALQTRLPIQQSHINAGLEAAFVPGRMQRWSEEPLVILDVAHNEDAACAVAEAVERLYPAHPVHLVLGMLADKEVAATVKVLRRLRPQWYLAAPDCPRALSSEGLAAIVNEASSGTFVSVAEAYRAARRQLANSPGGEVGLVLVLGSFFTVAEVMGLEPRSGV